MALITTRAIIQGIRASSKPRPLPRMSFNKSDIQETTSVNSNPVVEAKVLVAFPTNVSINSYFWLINDLSLGKEKYVSFEEFALNSDPSEKLFIYKRTNN